MFDTLLAFVPLLALVSTTQAWCPGTPFPVLTSLLDSNTQWLQGVDSQNASFFSLSSLGQAPSIFWLGCSDSRVPESVILNAQPGTVFTHRNIANQFHPDDVSVQFGVDYAINELGVQHIVVVGHQSCGGCKAALAAALATNTGCNCQTPIPGVSRCGCPLTTSQDLYLADLTDLASSLNLNNTPTTQALEAVVEANIKLQVQRVVQSDAIQTSWAQWESGAPNATEVWVHGWIYELDDGQVTDLNISQGPVTPGVTCPASRK